MKPSERIRQREAAAAKRRRLFQEMDVYRRQERWEYAQATAREIKEGKDVRESVAIETGLVDLLIDYGYELDEARGIWSKRVIEETIHTPSLWQRIKGWLK